MQDVYTNRVRFEETDLQGVVFYGNYFTYQDETLIEFLDAAGFPMEKREEMGWTTHVVHVDLDYRDSARVRDELVNSMRVSAIRDSSIEYDYECRRQADGAVLVEGSLVHVAVDDEGESVTVPDEFREAVAAFQDEPPEPC